MEVQNPLLVRAKNKINEYLVSKTLKYRKSSLLKGLFLYLPLGLFLIYIIVFYITLPDVKLMRSCLVTQMYKIELCPNDSVSDDRMSDNRIRFVIYNDISPELINAVVSSEDSAFFHHKGLDWYEIRQSFIKNLKKMGYARGGSTITQQLAKNVFLTKDKSIIRKVKEAILAIRIEDHYSKEEILELYLNLVEFGPNIFGIHHAANYYFQKNPHQLHILEAVFLAFLLPNPKEHSKNFESKQLSPYARKTLLNLIKRMRGLNKISPESSLIAMANIDGFPWRHLGQESFTFSQLNFNSNSQPEMETDSQSDTQFDNEAEYDTDTDTQIDLETHSDTESQSDFQPDSPMLEELELLEESTTIGD